VNRIWGVGLPGWTVGLRFNADFSILGQFKDKEKNTRCPVLVLSDRKVVMVVGEKDRNKRALFLAIFVSGEMQFESIFLPVE
jgi:hypothetical protein